jgi:hypothetical protein
MVMDVIHSKVKMIGTMKRVYLGIITQEGLIQVHVGLQLYWQQTQILDTANISTLLYHGIR